MENVKSTRISRKCHSFLEGDGTPLGTKETEHRIEVGCVWLINAILDQIEEDIGDLHVRHVNLTDEEFELDSTQLERELDHVVLTLCEGSLDTAFGRHILNRRLELKDRIRQIAAEHNAHVIFPREVINENFLFRVDTSWRHENALEFSAHLIVDPDRFELVELGSWTVHFNEAQLRPFMSREVRSHLDAWGKMDAVEVIRDEVRRKKGEYIEKMRHPSPETLKCLKIIGRYEPSIHAGWSNRPNMLKDKWTPKS